MRAHLAEGALEPCGHDCVLEVVEAGFRCFQDVEGREDEIYVITPVGRHSTVVLFTIWWRKGRDLNLPSW